MDRQRPQYPARVLVVGGSKGVGRQTVIDLTARGSHCVIGYSTDDDAAAETAQVAAGYGRKPETSKGDMSTDAALLVAQAAERLGGLEAIVVTAAPVVTGRALSLTADQLEKVTGVLMWGLLDTVRAAVPYFEEARGGSVVVVTSLGARYYAKYYGTLGPAKAAAEAYVRTLAAELGPRQIRVNAIAPCLINDERHTNFESRAHEFLDLVAKRTPLRRLASPEEIASAIVGVLSSDFSFVTGQIIDVDGGSR